MAGKKKKNFLNNKDLAAEVIACKETNIMSDKLARMLILLTAKYSKHWRWSGYTYNDDMQGHAMMVLCKSWASFDPSFAESQGKTPNAFAYYTKGVHRSFLQFLNREKKQRIVRDEMLVKNGYNPSFTYQNEHSTSDEHYMVDSGEDDYSND